MGKVVNGVYQSGLGEAKKTEPNPNQFFAGSSGTKARAPLEGGGTAVTFGSSESGSLGQAETINVASFEQRKAGTEVIIAEKKAAEEAKKPIFSEQSLYASRTSYPVTPVKRFRDEEGQIKGFESPIEQKSYYAKKGNYPEERVSQYERETSGEQVRVAAAASKPIIEIGTYKEFSAEAPFALQQALAEDKGFLPDIIGSRILKTPERLLGLKPSININQSFGEFTNTTEFKSESLLSKASDIMGFGFGRGYEAMTSRPVSTLGNLAPFVLLDIGTMGLGKVARTGVGLLTLGGIGAYKEIKEPRSVLSGWGLLETATEFGTFALPIKGISFGLQKLNTYSLNVRARAYQKAVEDMVIIKIPQKKLTSAKSEIFETLQERGETSFVPDVSKEVSGATTQVSLLKLETKQVTMQSQSVSTISFMKQLGKNNPFKSMGTAAGADTSLIGENFLSSKLKFLSGGASSGLAGNLKSISDVFSGQKRKAQIQEQQQKEIFKGFDFQQEIRLKQETKQKTKQKQKQIVMPKMVVGVGQKLSLGLKQKQTSVLKQEQVSIQMPKLFQELKTKQQQVQKQEQVQNQIQVQSQVQRQLQRQQQKQISIQEQVQIVEQKKENLFKFPKLKFGFGKNIGTPSAITAKFNPRYTPSLEATFFNIKRTRMQKSFTGMELRGL